MRRVEAEENAETCGHCERQHDRGGGDFHRRAGDSLRQQRTADTERNTDAAADHRDDGL